MQIEDAMIFVKKHINLGSRIDGKYREDFYELPIDSIREMISNAVCHRSYLSPGTIQVAIYDDRLEVTSPGRLSPDLSIEQIIAGNSRIQNSAIGAAFFYMHIIEKWGSGIPRIFADSKQYGLGIPEIKDFGSSLRISIRRKAFDTDPFGVVDLSLGLNVQHQSSASDEAQLRSSASSSASDEAKHQSSVSDTEKNSISNTDSRLSHLNKVNLIRALSILEQIKLDPHVTSDDIAQKIGLSRATVQRAIAELKTVGILSRNGSNNGGVWIIHFLE